MLYNFTRNSLRHIREFFQWLKEKVCLHTSDLDQLNYFVVFIGNPRSGTTLVRTLLDAHPSIKISNEVDVLKLLKAGKKWNTIIGKVILNSNNFLKKPIWTGYSYKIKNQYNKKSIKILGDKKSAKSTKILVKEPRFFLEFQQLIPVPVLFIHCVRHPYDVISTKTRHNQKSITENSEQYFFMENSAAKISSLAGSRRYKRIYHEDLISNPFKTLKDLLNSLDLTTETQYYESCQKLIYKSPNYSRFSSNWTRKDLEIVEQEVLNCEHLSYYLKEGKLVFINKE